MEVEELVVLLLEGGDRLVEEGQNGSDVLEVVLLEGLKLLDGAEKFDKLGDSAAEEVELAEDLVG